ncbi:hypothetical protein ACSBR2_025669 [Camellia fascicularis]
MPKLEARRDTSPRDKRYDSRNSILEWSILLIDNSNRSGSMDFVVPPVEASVFFPISVRFTAASTFSELKVLNVLPLRGGPSPRFAQRTLLSTENYQVIYFSEYVAQCVSKFIIWSDDTEAVVQERLRIYNKKKNVKTPNIFADESAEKEMRRYIKASLPVIEYIDKLYVSRNISLDW